MVLRSSVTLLVGSMACLLVGCAEERGAPPQEIMTQQMNIEQATHPDQKNNQDFNASEHFAEYDQNADGKLTEKEIEGWMDGADADKNGEITQQELADWKPPSGASGSEQSGATGGEAKKKGGFGTGAAGTGTGEGTSP